MSTAFAYSPAEIAGHLAGRAEDVARHLVPGGRIEGHQYVIGDIHGAEGDSLQIVVRDVAGKPKPGYWKDWAEKDEFSGDLLDLWMLARGFSRKGDAMKESLAWLGLDPVDQANKKPAPAQPKKKPAPKPQKLEALQANDQFLQRRHSKLKGHADAMAWVESRGLAGAVDRFQLGLSDPYQPKEGPVRENSLTFPVLAENGRFVKRYGYIDIPGVSKGSLDKSWMSGAPLTYYSEARTFEHTYVMVVEGQKDLWRMAEFIDGTNYAGRMLIISSTHGSGMPDEWRNASYWAQYRKVFAAQDNDKAGDGMAERLAEVACKEVFRVRIPNDLLPEGEDGADWGDWLNTNPTLTDFELMLRDAEDVLTGASVIGEDSSDFDSMSLGRHNYTPMDPNGGFHKGCLYYPMRVHRVVEVDEVKTERLDDVVIRSDGKILQVAQPNVAKGTDKHKIIFRLTDGTLIGQHFPAPNPRATWAWESAQEWIEGRHKQWTGLELYQRVLKHLRGSVWLPNENDYTLLALTVMATYIQTVFDAVPYILAVGNKGSGKSELGGAMADISCNSRSIGASTAATMSRQIHEAKGFIFIDDLEGIGNASKNKNMFSETLQHLKVGYKKATSIRYVTDPKTMYQQELNMFGIKMITNTLGTDDILGSRMLKIQTRSLSPGQPFNHAPLTLDEQYSLRQALHQWAFDNCKAISDVYRNKFYTKSSREDEISAPLFVIADHIDDPKVSDSLQIALHGQRIIDADTDDDPAAVLLEACDSLIRKGYMTPPVEQIILEMSTMVEDGYGQDYTTEIPDWKKSRWVSMTLRRYGDIVDVERSNKRIRMNGKSLRTVAFTRERISAVLEKYRQEGDIHPVEPRSFCNGCSTCPYSTHGCDMMEQRMKMESEG